MYAAYKDNPDVAMFLVYVREAHPVKAPKNEGKPKGPQDITQPKTDEERVLAADACMKGLKLTLPVVIDNVAGDTGRAYRGVPAATAIVDLDGNVVFHSTGPGGVQPKAADRELKKLLAAMPPKDAAKNLPGAAEEKVAE